MKGRLHYYCLLKEPIGRVLSAECDMAKKRFSKSNVLWFIRTRSYTPVADLRRRFHLDCEMITVIPEPGGNIYVSLPEREANMVHQLWREGKIGMHWLLRVDVRVVDGVFPMVLSLEKENGRPSYFLGEPGAPAGELTEEGQDDAVLEPDSPG
jgi:hypothetical protein